MLQHEPGSGVTPCALVKLRSTVARRARALHASLSLLPNLGPQSLPKSSCALTDHGCLEHEMEAELICLAIRRGVSSTGASKDAVAITCAVRSVRTKQRLEPGSVGGWWIRRLRGCAFSVPCVLSVCVFRRKQVARGFTYVAPTPHRILREKHRMDSSAIGGIDGTRPTMH